MDFALFVVRVLLAVVFVTAGVGKLREIDRAYKTVADFGAPTWFARPFGYFLPFLEISVACLLVPASAMIWGAIGAFVLLVSFAAAIGLNLARGNRPVCNCVGQLDPKPISTLTLLRSIFLAGLAGALIEQSLHRPILSVAAVVAQISMTKAVIVGLWVSFAFLSAAQIYLIFHLFRQNGRLLLRIEALEDGGGKPAVLTRGAKLGLAVGTPAPDFELTEARGRILNLASLLGLGKPVLLVFSDADCGPCKALLPQLVRWQRAYAERFTVAVIGFGVSTGKSAVLTSLDYLFINSDRGIAERYDVHGTPAAVLVSQTGTVASNTVAGEVAISALVLGVAGGSLPSPMLREGSTSVSNTVPIGSPAPALTLPDLASAPIP